MLGADGPHVSHLLPGDLHIIRSRRRTVSLIITREPSLVVRAPLCTSLASIEELVRRKRAWIEKKITERKARPRPRTIRLIDGEEFLFLGRAHPLRIVDDASVDVELEDGLCISRGTLPRARQLLVRWYREQARRIISERCRFYASLMGAPPSMVRVTGAKHRWGSCSAKGSVNFSWRLVMAPIGSIDYVVVHELVHLLHLHHGRSFWKKVEEILPEYQAHERWLREYEGALTLAWDTETSSQST